MLIFILILDIYVLLFYFTDFTYSNEGNSFLWVKGYFENTSALNGEINMLDIYTHIDCVMH